MYTVYRVQQPDAIYTFFGCCARVLTLSEFKCNTSFQYSEYSVNETIEAIWLKKMIYSISLCDRNVWIFQSSTCGAGEKGKKNIF